LLYLLKNQPLDDRNSSGPLLIYARASVLMKNGLNDEAIEVLHERVHLTQTFPFCYLDYLEGVARLNKLDDSASVCFEKFITGFHGRNYIRSAYQKLAWIALLGGDSAGYHRTIDRVTYVGASVVDEDKQAEIESLKGPVPNIILLRSRLLFDGGYYQKALGELLNHPVKITVRAKRDLVEYTYRLGRIYHETGNLIKAIENYEQTVLRGRSEPCYYAAGAAFQLGLIYENKGEYSKADSAYRLCLSINTPEYRTSLHQKAKAGLNRLKKTPFKT
jgi:tetratricopeptide (TPR) repeat protein